MKYDLVIIGSGPSGLTAGIYGGRGGLKVLILDKAPVGGNVNVAPLIENYPGVDGIVGKELIENMKKQAEKYCEIQEFATVEKIDKGFGSTFRIITNKENYTAEFVILATGTTYKTLEVPGISEFNGRGVSYCAVCDGNFFVDKEVLVIGGGNTAATEALYLNKIGVKCSIVHRRNSLRCDMQLQKEIAKNKIPVYWNYELKEVKGNNAVEEAVLYNNQKDKDITLPVSGIFIAIGHAPNSQLAVDYGVDVDEDGYIEVDEEMRTNIGGIYATGDVTGGIKQIIVACGQGAIAATKINHQLV